MKKSLLKSLAIFAIALSSASVFAQAPISPVPAGGANAYPGGTPTQSPNGLATPGYNSNAGTNTSSPPAPIGNGYAGTTGSTPPPASMPGSTTVPSPTVNPTNPVRPSNTPQNPGSQDQFSPGGTPHK